MFDGMQGTARQGGSEQCCSDVVWTARKHHGMQGCLMECKGPHGKVGRSNAAVMWYGRLGSIMDARVFDGMQGLHGKMGRSNASVMWYGRQGSIMECKGV